MSKKFLVVLLALFVAFVMIGCPSSTTEKPNNEGDFDNLWNDKWVPGASKDGPTRLELGDNFQYGTGYQGLVGWASLLNTDINVNGVYQLEIEFKVDRDLEDELQWVLCNTSPTAPTPYWTVLSRWKTIVKGNDKEEGPVKPGEDPPDGPVTPSGDGFKTTDTISYVGRVVTTGAAAKNVANLVFQTKGEGTKGTAGSGKEGPVNLTFTKFKITKLDWGSASEPEPEPEIIVLYEDGAWKSGYTATTSVENGNQVIEFNNAIPTTGFTTVYIQFSKSFDYVGGSVEGNASPGSSTWVNNQYWSGFSGGGTTTFSGGLTGSDGTVGAFKKFVFNSAVFSEVVKMWLE